MNLQTLAPPTCDSTVVAVCLWIPEAVVEMKDCPCFRKDHVTHMVWFHFVSFFCFSFSPSIATDFQSNTLFKTYQRITGRIKY